MRKHVYHQVVSRFKELGSERRRIEIGAEEEREQCAMKIPQFDFVWSVDTVASE